MALIQKLHGENRTFDELSDAILNQVLTITLELMFDTYKIKSIKSSERRNRSSDSEIHFKNIKIIKWRFLLQSGDSKNKITMFFIDSWQEESKRTMIGNKTLYVTYSKKCIKITDSGFIEVE